MLHRATVAGTALLACLILAAVPALAEDRAAPSAAPETPVSLQPSAVRDALAYADGAAAQPGSGRTLYRTQARSWRRLPNCDECYTPPCPWRLTLAGTFALIDDPEGPVGLPLGVANQLQWGGNEYDGQFGALVTLGRSWTNKTMTEVRGRWWSEFDGSSAQTGVFGVAPGPTASGVGNATLNSDANFWGLDAMHWWAVHCCDCNRFLLGGGVSVQRFDETAAFATQTGAIGAAAPLPASARAEVENLFFGVQLGAAWRADMGQRTEFGVTVRGLVGGLNRDIDVSDVNILAAGPHANSDEETAFGWGGEVGVSVVHQLTGRIAVTAGYNLLILGEIVRAHDAMDFGQPATGAVQPQHVTDTLIAHEIFVGVVLNL
jgi:hypothetical protein